jgi:PEP-CTERM motif
MSRRAALVLSIALALPVSALANNFSFQNSGGRITSNGQSLSLTASNVMSVNGFNGGSFSGNLGSLSFTTGILTGGSLAASATFAAGGSFVITANGAHGLPGGTLFTGTFSSPVNWVAMWNPTGFGGRGNWSYKLSGTVIGTLSNGQTVSSRFVAYTFDVPGGLQFSSSVRFNNGVAALSAPEPATMALLGSGLVGIAAVGLRKCTKTAK